MGAIGRIFSTPKTPKAPAMPAYTPPPPVPVDNSAEIEAEKAKQRAIAANAVWPWFDLLDLWPGTHGSAHHR